MNVKQWVLAGILMLPSLAVAQPAIPEPPLSPHGEMRWVERSAGVDGPMGIPPEVAAKLGIPAETVKKIKDQTYEANVQVIGLEADLKRAQLELDRVLSNDNPDEGAVMNKVEAVGRAELQIRKNRIGVMLKVRKLLGAQLWQKVQTELPPGEHNVMFFRHGGGLGGPGPRRIEIIRREERHGGPELKETP